MSVHSLTNKIRQDARLVYTLIFLAAAADAARHRERAGAELNHDLSWGMVELSVLRGS